MSPAVRYFLSLCAVIAAVTVPLAITGLKADPVSPPAGRELAPQDVLAEARRIARGVEQVRNLRFERQPQSRVVSAAQIREIFSDLAPKGGERAELRAGEAALKLLGLLAPEEGVTELANAIADETAGAYDPRSERLYVVRGIGLDDPALVEITLAHELNHALEDQRFGLPEGGPSDDAALARIALAEGSATALMTDYGTEYIPPLELLQGAAGVDSGTGGVPQFYLDQLLWAYTGGERFITELRELGGGWKLVDYALESRPPASTEQVIHTDKYLSDERPQELTLEASALQAEGWRRVDSGSLGELTTAQLLAVGAPQATANRAAAGWGGDEYGLWSRGAAPAGCEAPCREDLVFVIDWAWDSPGEVEEFERAAGSYVKQGLGGRSAGDDLWEVEGGSVALAAGGAETTLVFAPDTELAAAVAAEQVVP